MAEQKIDPTQRILMWLCAEKRISAAADGGPTVSQDEMAERVRARGGAVGSKGLISRWERGERWLDGARPVIQAYADIAGIQPADLWDEAVRLTPYDDPPFLDAPAARLEDVPQHLEALRALAARLAGQVAE